MLLCKAADALLPPASTRGAEIRLGVHWVEGSVRQMRVASVIEALQENLPSCLAIARAGATYREVKRGDSLQVGDLTLKVAGPAGNTGQNLNNQPVELCF